MKTVPAYALLLSLLLRIVAATAAGTPGDPPLPDDAQPACSGNVDDFGEPGKRLPSSISWQSYSSNQAVSAVASFYERQFKAPAERDRHGGLSWRPGVKLIYTVYPAAPELPWLACVPDHQGMAAVIVVSTLGR